MTALFRGWRARSLTGSGMHQSPQEPRCGFETDLAHRQSAAVDGQEPRKDGWLVGRAACGGASRPSPTALAPQQPVLEDSDASLRYKIVEALLRPQRGFDAVVEAAVGDRRGLG